MGWHRAEDTWWPVIADGLVGVWSRQACLMDMRWYGDRKHHTGERIPSRAFFMSRWRWSERRTRNLIASFEWWDPEWGDEADQDWGPAAANRRRSEKGPKRVRERSEEGPSAPRSNAQNAQGKVRDGSEEGPKRVRERSTGALDTPTPAPAPTLKSPSETMSSDRQSFDKLATRWAELASQHRGDRRVRAPKWSSKASEETKGLKRLIKEGVVDHDIDSLMRWHWLGPDPQRNRAQGRGLMTLARHHDRYLVMAADWAAGRSPSRSPRGDRSWSMEHALFGNHDNVIDIEPARARQLEGD